MYDNAVNPGSELEFTVSLPSSGLSNDATYCAVVRTSRLAHMEIAHAASSASRTPMGMPLSPSTNAQINLRSVRRRAAHTLWYTSPRQPMTGCTRQILAWLSGCVLCGCRLLGHLRMDDIADSRTLVIEARTIGLLTSLRSIGHDSHSPNESLMNVIFTPFNWDFQWLRRSLCIMAGSTSSSRSQYVE